jgi:dienelactone hydrolase
LTGEWLGAVTKPDGSIASLTLHFEDAKLSVEPLTTAWPMTVTQNGEDVTFLASGKSKEPFTQIKFAGTFSQGNLSGALTWDGEESSVTFSPIATVEPALLETYEGLYSFESGRALSILVSPEYTWGGLSFFSQTLMMTDLENGDLRALYPFDDYTFAVGALRVVGAPFVGRIQFIQDDQGNTTGLMWWDEVDGITPSSTSGQFAKRVEYQQEDVTFTSADGVKLAGRISLPESNSPAPAFMMLHGSEPGTRDNFGAKQMAHYMISQGFAILNYDKRGVGDSEGFYQEAPTDTNLKNHANDAAAGAEYLASRPEIDAKRIGLIGGSQAGWVIPLAAAQSERISYFVILSGPVTSTAQEDRFSTYTNDGESAMSNYDDAKITQQIRAMRPIGFDPMPVISGLTQPGVWLWGGVDKNIPVTFSAENLQAVIDSGKNNFSYQIFPNADHGLNISPNGLFAELPYSPGVAFYPALTEWLKQNTSVSQGR